MNFGGISSEFTDYKNSPIVILPVPYDETSTWIKGADRGPEAILEASANMELYDIETDSEIFRLGIHTSGPVLEKASPDAMVKAVYEKVRKFLGDGKFVVTLGGEHSVTIGPAMAFTEAFPGISVLQIDAHTDLRQEYEGSRFNHACVMARVREMCPIVQVGIRSMDITEKPFMDKERVFFAHEIAAGQGNEWMEDVIDLLSDKVYITIDMDGFDPSVVPATGTPEPGGLSYYQVISLLRNVVARKNVMGFDVVELCPMSNHKSSDFVASKLIYQILTYKFALK